MELAARTSLFSSETFLPMMVFYSIGSDIQDAGVGFHITCKFENR
jgi:hypothetical protein